MTYLLLISMISAMGGLLFGYDWVVIGGAKIFYEVYFGISDSVSFRGWAMSSALVGCLVGALLAGLLSDKFGRKKMLILASILFLVAAIGTGAADSFTGFIIYRILGGFGIGVASNVSPVYIAEVSPAKIRGKFVSLYQLTIVIGILAAQLVNWKIGDHYSNGAESITADGVQWAWRWMFWASIFPAILFFVSSFFLPESPRWLCVKGRVEPARRIFAGIGGDAFAVKSINEIQSFPDTSDNYAIGAILKPGIRRVMAIGIVLAVFQQFSGINIIFNYAHEIFSAAGYSVSDVLMNIVITGIINLIFTVVAIYTVDRWGRRSLMLFGSAALVVIYAIMGTCYFLNIHGLPLLILVVLAIASYAMSLAPVVWVLLSEIFPNRIRGLAMAVATFCLWLASFLMTYTFPFLVNILGSYGTFWFYGGICLMGFVFIYRNLPETKGKSLEDIEQELIKKQ